MTKPNNPVDFVIPDNLEYNPETGELWRIFKEGPRLISYVSSCGYIQIRIEGVDYLAHRVIWFMETGEWPEEAIDHVNGDRTNNRFENLREASRSENNRNTKLRSDNTSGVKGVCWDKNSGSWKVYIRASGKLIHVGLFKDLEEAKKIIKAARVKFHKGFANHG